jgi:hypothetical protein
MLKKEKAVILGSERDRVWRKVETKGDDTSRVGEKDLQLENLRL